MCDCKSSCACVEMRARDQKSVFVCDCQCSFIPFFFVHAFASYFACAIIFVLTLRQHNVFNTFSQLYHHEWLKWLCMNGRLLMCVWMRQLTAELKPSAL